MLQCRITFCNSGFRQDCRRDQVGDAAKEAGRYLSIASACTSRLLEGVLAEPLRATAHPEDSPYPSRRRSFGIPYRFRPPPPCPMPIELNAQERAEATHSLKKYFAEEMDASLSDMRAGFLLDYVLKEIAPFAYNRGVQDAEEFFRKRLEDLPATCFEPPLTYWQAKRKR